MIQKTFSILLIGYIFILGIEVQANNIIDKDNIINVPPQKFLRFMDNGEEYGKSCEEYSYITSTQRLKLLKQNYFMLGDILNDSLSISIIDKDDLVETNLTECNNQDMYVSEYTYREKLTYINENIITIEVFQYAYGAGAAHGNGNIAYSVYDREYGMKLDWDNLFDKHVDLDKYILKRVIEEIANPGFITYFKAENSLSNFRAPGHFAIIDEGLIIQYGKYEIAPGASGLPSLMVPKEVLKQYMTKGMYEKCFATKAQMIVKAMHD